MARCMFKRILTDNELRRSEELHKRGDKRAFGDFMSRMGVKYTDASGRLPSERAQDALFGGAVAAGKIGSSIFRVMDWPFAQLESHVLRPINLAISTHIHAPIAERVAALAETIYTKTGSTALMRVGATLIEKALSTVPGIPIDANVKKAFRKFAGEIHASAHQMANLEEALRKGRYDEAIKAVAKEGQQEAFKELRRVFKEELGKSVTDDQLALLDVALHEYEGLDGLETAESYRPRLDQKWTEILDLTGFVITNPELFRIYSTYRGIGRIELDRQLSEKREEGLLSSAQRQPMGKGVNYVPEHDLVSLGGRSLRGPGDVLEAGADPFPQELASTKARKYRDGMFQRVADGQILRNVDMPSLIAKEAYNTDQVILARQYKRSLYGTVITDKSTGQEFDAALWDNGGAWESIVKGGREKFYKEVDSPAFRGAEGEGKRLMVHRDLAKLLNNYLAPGEQGILKGVTRLNAKLKTMKLKLSAFHYVALMMNAAAYDIDPVALMKEANYRALMENPEVLNGIRSGLTMDAPDIGRNEIEIQKIFNNPNNALTSRIHKVEKKMDKALWGVLYRSVKAATYLELKNRLIQAGTEPGKAAEDAASSINAQSGGINWDFAGVSKRARQGLSLMALAPDWQLSNWAYATRSVFDSSPVGAVTRSSIMKYLLASYVYGNIANKMFTGQWMYENDEGDRDKIAIPVRGSTFMFDPFRHNGESIRVVMGLINSIPDELLDKEIAEGRAPGAYLSGKISALGKLSTEALTGRGFWTNRALPTVYDLFGKKHERFNPTGMQRPWGNYGQQTRGRADATLYAFLNSVLPIPAATWFENYVHEHDSFFDNPQALFELAGQIGSERFEDRKARLRRAAAEKGE